MKNLRGSIPYEGWEMELLRSDRELGIECVKMALESLENPEERAGGLLTLRAVAEAYGGLGAVAAQAGMSRESLYRTLSPKGNPTLKTLIAILNTLGLRLSVVPAKKAAQRKKAPQKARKLGVRKATRSRTAARAA